MQDENIGDKKSQGGQNETYQNNLSIENEEKPCEQVNPRE
jgi:hypothetical protein